MKDENIVIDQHSPIFIQRESTIVTVPEKVSRKKVLAFPLTPDSEYVVDDSNFVPISEAIKQLRGNSVSAGEIEQSYDFPNGIDNGMNIPINRRTDVKDITEISTAIVETADKISDEIIKGREKAKRQKSYEESMNAIVQNPTTPTKTE